MPPGSGTSLPAALRQLTDHTATTVAATTRVLARATAEAITDTAHGRRTPLGTATDALRWWSAVTDRRPPGWHTPNEIVLSTPFAHLRDFTAPRNRSDDVVPTLVLPPQAGHSCHIVDYSPEQSQIAAIAAAGLTRLHAWTGGRATPATRTPRSPTTSR